MSGIQNEDYLMRQARAVAAMLARILGLRTSGQTEEAKAELAKAYTALLGAQAELLKRLEVGAAADYLGSAERTVALAALCNEEAAQDADAARRGWLRVRALELVAEASLRYRKTEEMEQFLQVVIPDLNRERLTPELQERVDLALRLLASAGVELPTDDEEEGRGER